MTALKNIETNKRTVSDDLRLCLSAKAPRIDLIVNRKQAHPSHYYNRFEACSYILA